MAEQSAPPLQPVHRFSPGRVALLLLSVLLFLGAAALGLLSLGLLSALAANGPLWLRSLGAVARTLIETLGLSGWSGVTQAFTMMLLTSLLAALAAYVKPRP